MDPGILSGVAQALARPEIPPTMPAGLTALRRALGERRPSPEARGRRAPSWAMPRRVAAALVGSDRRGAWWRLSLARGRRARWCQVPHRRRRLDRREPVRGAPRAWGRSDPSCLAPRSRCALAPREAHHRLRAVGLGPARACPAARGPARPCPPMRPPRCSNLLAGLMRIRDLARVRYRGPYPSETLSPAARVLPPRSRRATRRSTVSRRGRARLASRPPRAALGCRGVSACRRARIWTGGREWPRVYRTDWQAITRREPRVIRAVGARRICSLWGSSAAPRDALVLSSAGRCAGAPPLATIPRAGAFKPCGTPRSPRSSRMRARPALDASIAETVAALTLEWGAIPGDCSA